MIAVENIFGPHPFVLSPFPFVLSPFPFVLSLSKDACRRGAHFDRRSASGISFRAPLLCSAPDAELWRQNASGLAGLRIRCEAHGGAAR